MHRCSGGCGGGAARWLATIGSVRFVSVQLSSAQFGARLLLRRRLERVSRRVSVLVFAFASALVFTFTFAFASTCALAAVAIAIAIAFPFAIPIATATAALLAKLLLLLLLRTRLRSDVVWRLLRRRSRAFFRSLARLAAACLLACELASARSSAHKFTCSPVHPFEGSQAHLFARSLACSSSRLALRPLRLRLLKLDRRNLLTRRPPLSSAVCRLLTDRPIRRRFELVVVVVVAA